MSPLISTGTFLQTALCLLFLSGLVGWMSRRFVNIPLFIHSFLIFGAVYVLTLNAVMLACVISSILPLYPLPFGQWIRSKIDIYGARWLYLSSIIGITLLIIMCAFYQPGYIIPSAIALCMVCIRFIQWQDELDAISRKESKELLATVLKT